MVFKVTHVGADSGVHALPVMFRVVFVNTVELFAAVEARCPTWGLKQLREIACLPAHCWVLATAVIAEVRSDYVEVRCYLVAEGLWEIACLTTHCGVLVISMETVEEVRLE